MNAAFKIAIMVFIFIIVFYFAFNKPDLEAEGKKKKEDKPEADQSVYAEATGFYKCSMPLKNTTSYFDYNASKFFPDIFINCTKLY